MPFHARLSFDVSLWCYLQNFIFIPRASPDAPGCRCFQSLTRFVQHQISYPQKSSFLFQITARLRETKRGKTTMHFTMHYHPLDCVLTLLYQGSCLRVSVAEGGFIRLTVAYSVSFNRVLVHVWEFIPVIVLIKIHYIFLLFFFLCMFAYLCSYTRVSFFCHGFGTTHVAIYVHQLQFISLSHFASLLHFPHLPFSLPLSTLTFFSSFFACSLFLMTATRSRQPNPVVFFLFLFPFLNFYVLHPPLPAHIHIRIL